MKPFISCIVAAMLVVCCIGSGSTPIRADVLLSQNGKTEFAIALAADAIPAEQNAAALLQKYLQQVTGANFPIQPETKVAQNAPQILVGNGARVKQLLAREAGSTPGVGEDGIVIKTIANKILILSGSRPRGTLYAVFEFLEDAVGVRWWTPTENFVPQKSTLSIPPQNVAYAPQLKYREHYTNSVQQSALFATAMRENGQAQPLTEEWGGHYEILGFVHTFDKLLPPEKYFKDHPEWYSDTANGNLPATANSPMPLPQHSQLCLSNPEVLEELSKNAIAWIDENPKAGYISISQNDNGNYCRDEACMKLAEAEGSQAAPVLDFVNKVAARIHAKYPAFKVETLAYQYTETPPKTIRPAKNVLIRLAPIGSDFGHPLDSDWNAQTRDNLRGWAKIAPDLFVWNYVTNFTGNILPHPNWTGIGPDLKFFVANNVRGMFEQGDAYTNGVGDFVQLRAWLIGKLMWNPNLDQQKLTTEFLRGYYGDAAPFLQQYIDLLQSSFLSQNRKLSTFNQDYSFITLDVANRAVELFDAAENAVKNNPEQLKRVQRERLSSTIAILYRTPILKRVAAREGKPFLGPKDPHAAMTKFISDAKAFGIRHWGEGVPFDTQLPRLNAMFAPPVDLPEFLAKYPPEDVIDFQPATMSLYRKGELSDIENDPLASGNNAATIIGTTNEWAIQASVSRVLEGANEKWHIYAIARVAAAANAAQTGAGFSAGAYDYVNKKAIFQTEVPLAQVAKSEYQIVDLGVQELNGGCYIWFAPTRNPAVTKLYLDRVLLVWEK
jgi:hypothetical protein